MTTKQYWHKPWQRDGAGLLHSSGFKALQAPGGTWVACLDSYPRWLAFEATQSTPAHQLDERQARLLKEAAQWRDPDQRRADHLAKRLPPGTKPQTQKAPHPHDAGAGLKLAFSNQRRQLQTFTDSHTLGRRILAGL